MAKKSKETLKAYFRTGLRPTQENFADFIEAMVHSETEIFISADQKVGIGTTSPKQKLDVQGAVQLGALVNDADKTPGTLEFSASKFRGFDGTAWKDLGGGGGGASFWDKTGNAPLTYKDEVIIPIDLNDLTGKVNLRLGDNSAGTKLEVFGRPPLVPGGKPVSIGIGSTDESKMVFHLNQESGGQFVFYDDKPENAGTNQLMMLTSAPRLFVGKMGLPDLTIEANANSRRGQPASGCTSGTGPSKTWAYLMADGSATDNSGLYWKDGKKFILASEPNIPANSQNAAASKTFLTCKPDGTVDIPKLTAVGTLLPPSDIRIKTKIEPFAKGLEVINKLDTIRFQFNNEIEPGKEDWHIGVSAQNLREVMPELVVNTEQYLNNDAGEKGMLAIKGNELVYLAFNAIKELNTKVERLEKLLAAAGIKDLGNAEPA